MAKDVSLICERFGGPSPICRVWISPEKVCVFCSKMMKVSCIQFLFCFFWVWIIVLSFFLWKKPSQGMQQLKVLCWRKTSPKENIEAWQWKNTWNSLEKKTTIFSQEKQHIFSLGQKRWKAPFLCTKNTEASQPLPFRHWWKVVVTLLAAENSSRLKPSVDSCGVQRAQGSLSPKNRVQLGRIQGARHWDSESMKKCVDSVDVFFRCCSCCWCFCCDFTLAWGRQKYEKQAAETNNGISIGDDAEFASEFNLSMEDLVATECLWVVKFCTDAGLVMGAYKYLEEMWRKKQSESWRFAMFLRLRWFSNQDAILTNNLWLE